jgi:hypothetical protein
MADNSYKIQKSLNLTPQSSSPANPTDGDIYFDASIGSFVFYHGGAWASKEAVGSVAAATSMTGALFTPSVVQNSVVRLTGTTAGSVHGMTSSFSGKMLCIYNNTTQTQIIKHQSGLEPTSNNRIVTPTAADISLVAGEIVTFVYDVFASRWALVSIGSNTAASAPATTTSLGLVKLHSIPADPANPFVLIDGDIGAADGVVGLDSNQSILVVATGGATGITTNGSGGGWGIEAIGGSADGGGGIFFGQGNGKGIWANGNGSGEAILAQAGSAAAGINAIGATASPGANFAAIHATGGHGGNPGVTAIGGTTYPGICAAGAGSTPLDTLFGTYGVIGGTFIGGSGGGAGLVAQGVGVGKWGLVALGPAAGFGLLAVAGTSGTAASFVGPVVMSTTLGVTGALSAGTISSGAITSNANITFTGSNPTTATGFTNTLTPKNIAKAWGKITTNGSGAVTLVEGFNISSTFGISGGAISVGFLNAMASTTYVLTGSVTGTGNVANVRNSGPSTTTCDIQIVSTTGIVNPISTAMTIDFVIFGNQ